MGVCARVASAHLFLARSWLRAMKLPHSPLPPRCRAQLVGLQHLVGDLLASHPWASGFLACATGHQVWGCLQKSRAGELSSERDSELQPALPVACGSSSVLVPVFLPGFAPGALSACWAVSTLLPARGSRVLIQCGSLSLSWRFV